MKHYDTIVIGGGHAGCEAAAAAARMGARVALIAMDRASIGTMSCNPAIGGIGKGHIVREVDALDGIMGAAADDAAIHYRMLNSKKGKAVQGPRVQADRDLYRMAVQTRLAEYPIDILEDEVLELIVAGAWVEGAVLRDGGRVGAASVVLASGTFLGGRMFFGRTRRDGGRWTERAAVPLGAQLLALGLPLGRFKTGTPPRLDGRTIDWGRLGLQPSDAARWTMSAVGRRTAPQLSCGITRTNEVTHDLIRRAMSESPLADGAITGGGPRYCPSIEDKVKRFGGRDGHQIFLEPEGLRSPLVYPNGISTSLPEASQRALVQSIFGLERATIVTPGYAVEYTYVDSRILDHRLAVRGFHGLFLAGQINGTTGYEEAAGQGIVAGLNAGAQALGKQEIILPRSESYIGVMIDDLVLQGVTEPYRMLTARAEHRLHLRADNAETRMEPFARAARCLRRERHEHDVRRSARMKSVEAIVSGMPEANVGSIELALEWAPALRAYPHSALEQVLEDRRYRPYVARQREELQRQAGRDRVLPAQLDYRGVRGLSSEMIERLELVRPRSLGEARRVQGITAVGLSALMMVSVPDQ